MTHPQTADRILQVASKLFAEKGYANVSVRDICKETDTTPPVIYYYFGSKKGLFDKVARENITMSAFISKLAASSASDPKESLKAFVSTYLSSFPERTFDTGLYLRDSATLDKESARMVGEDLEKVRKMALKLVKSLMSEGGFRKTDAELATECLLGMLNRVIFQHIHFAKASDRDSYTKFVTEFFFKAMR